MSWRWCGHQWSWRSSAQPCVGSSDTSLQGAWLQHTHLCTVHGRKPCQTACPLAHQLDVLWSLLQGLVMLCEYLVLLYMRAGRLWVVKAMCQISCRWWKLLNSITNFFLLYWDELNSVLSGKDSGYSSGCIMEPTNLDNLRIYLLFCILSTHALQPCCYLPFSYSILDRTARKMSFEKKLRMCSWLCVLK